MGGIAVGYPEMITHMRHLGRSCDIGDSQGNALTSGQFMSSKRVSARGAKLPLRLASHFCPQPSNRHAVYGRRCIRGNCGCIRRRYVGNQNRNSENSPREDCLRDFDPTAGRPRPHLRQGSIGIWPNPGEKLPLFRLCGETK